MPTKTWRELFLGFCLHMLNDMRHHNDINGNAPYDPQEMQYIDATLPCIVGAAQDILARRKEARTKESTNDQGGN